MKFTIKVFSNGQMILKSMTHKTKRFYKILNSIKFENDNVTAYLKVSYGKMTCGDRRIEQHNEGYYDSRSDLLSTFKVFVEKQ